MRPRGFTIVELITVIAILSILAITTTRFMTDASSGYASAQSRAALVESVTRAMLTVSREVRQALPNSIRVGSGGTCLEWVPIVDGNYYLQAPIGYAGTTVQVLPLQQYTLTANTRVAIHPETDLYALADPGALSPTIDSVTTEAMGEQTLQWGSTHTFARGSAQDRAYIVGSPASYCLDNGRLWHYSNYGFLASQPTVASLPSSLPDRVLVAGDVDATSSFSLTPATLQRNATVKVRLIAARDGDRVPVEQLINVRHSP